MSKDPEADYNAALKLKDAGNAAFKQKDFKLALKNYSRIFMYLGMNPCMNMGAVMGGADPTAQSNKPKDPLEAKTDELRLTAFNNIAAVYARQEKWTECLEKCERVLKHDANNQKALFRRAKSHRHLNNFEKARDDLKKLRELQGDKVDKGVVLEEKLVKKGEKQQEKQFLKQMQKAMAKDRKKSKKKQQKQEKQQKEQSSTQSSPAKPMESASSTEKPTEAPTNDAPMQSEAQPSTQAADAGADATAEKPSEEAQQPQQTLVSIPSPDAPRDNNNSAAQPTGDDFVPMQF